MTGASVTLTVDAVGLFLISAPATHRLVHLNARWKKAKHRWCGPGVATSTRCRLDQQTISALALFLVRTIIDRCQWR